MAAATFEDTPLSRTLEVIGGKYKTYIIWRLSSGPMRFGELHSFFQGVTAHILSRQLRELERDGLVSRKVVSENPPWVEYSLTTTGISLLPVIEAMAEWGAAYVDMERMKSQLSGSSRLPG